MKLNDIIKAFKEGNQAELPEDMQFLLDPEFQKEIAQVGGKEEKIRAAADVLGQTSENVDEGKIDELVSAMQETGLLEDGEQENDEESEEIPEKDEEGREVAVHEDEEGDEEASEEPESEEGEEAPPAAPQEEEVEPEEEEAVEGEEHEVAMPGEEERQANEEGVNLREEMAEEEPSSVGDDLAEVQPDNEQSRSVEPQEEEQPVDGGSRLERVIRRSLAALEGMLRSD